MKKAKWKSPETVPKNRTILVDLGYPWPLVATYSPADGTWSAAEIESSTYDGVNEFYFVTERFSQNEILGWMDLPDVLPRNAE